MQRIARTLGCLVLALALVLTGPGGAGPAKGAMLVELCADGASSLVWIDADGAPLPSNQSHANCLDCLLFSAPLPDAADGRLGFDPLRLTLGLSRPVPSLHHPVAHLRPLPRGPPVAEKMDMRHGDPRPATRSLHLSAPQSLDFHQADLLAGVTDPRATF